jgi:hypothetical protein
MLFTERTEFDTVVLRVLKSRLAVTDADRFHSHVMSALQREGVGSISIDMERVDLADESLINVVRSLAKEGDRRGRRVWLKSAPPALWYLLPAERGGEMGDADLEAEGPSKLPSRLPIEAWATAASAVRG